MFARLAFFSRPPLRLSVLVLGTAVFMAGCSGSRQHLKLGKQADGEVVESEGFAPYESNDILKTKRGSLVDAQRNAVEKVVGVFVSGKTMVEKAVAIENNILARTDGYVKTYEILSEGVSSGNLYRTKIRALVALKDLEKDLKDLSLLRTPELSRPRIAVDLTEEANGAPSEEHAASSALERSLTNQGFVVVSGDRVKEAELVVKGKAGSYPFQSGGLGGFISYRARLSGQVVRAGTNDVVLSFSKEASGLGGSEMLAALKALETVGDLTGTEMGADLVQKENGKNLLVFVEGVKSFEDVDRVRKHLSSQPGVADIMLRMYDEQMAQFEVLLNSIRATDLASTLDKSSTLALKVIEAKPQTLRLKMN